MDRARRGLAAGVATLAIVGAGSPACAHPMGNISISHYAGLEVRPAEVEIKFLLDFAEIPAARELERVDPDRDDLVTPAEREDYLEAKTAEVLPQLRLEVNGRPLPLRRETHHVSFPPGESGLSTVRVAWRFLAELPADVGERNFLLWNDATYETFDGWKEIRFSGVDGVGIGKTSLREQPTSGELTEYPEEYLLRPPRDTKAWCQFGPEEIMAASRQSAATTTSTAGAPTSEPSRSTGPNVVVIVLSAIVVGVLVALLRRTLRRRSG
jgi:hypothetical protein